MVALYGFLSRLSGCMAGVCAVLALLAVPAIGRADDACDCQDLIGDPMAYTDCVNHCNGTITYDCTNKCSSPFCPGVQANPCRNYGCSGDNEKCKDNGCACYGTKQNGKYDCKGCD